VGIVISALAVAIAPPLITVAVIAIAPSVKAALATSGLWLGRMNFCRLPMSMLSSLSLTNSTHWRCRVCQVFCVNDLDFVLGVGFVVALGFAVVVALGFAVVVALGFAVVVGFGDGVQWKGAFSSAPLD
jgi:hypothetical protein